MFNIGDKVILIQGGTLDNNFLGIKGTVCDLFPSENNVIVILDHPKWGAYGRLMFSFCNVQLYKREVNSHMPSWF